MVNQNNEQSYLEQIIEFSLGTMEFIREEIVGTVKSAIPTYRLFEKKKKGEKIIGEDILPELVKLALIGTTRWLYVAIDTTEVLPKLFANNPDYYKINYLLYLGFAIQDSYRNLRLGKLRFNDYMKNLQNTMHINERSNLIEKTTDTIYAAYRDFILGADNFATNVYAISIAILGFAANNVFNVFDIKRPSEMKELMDTIFTNPSILQHYLIIYGIAKIPSDAVRNKLKINGNYDKEKDGHDIRYELAIAGFGAATGIIFANIWEKYEANTDMGTSPLDTMVDLYVGAIAAVMGGFDLMTKGIVSLKDIPYKVSKAYDSYVHKFAKQDLYFGLQPPNRIMEGFEKPKPTKF